MPAGDPVLPVGCRPGVAISVGKRSCNLDGAPNVSVHIKCDQIELPPEQAVPVGLIINELVTNAIKHAFIDQPAGFIEIKLEGVTQLDLVVEDNGAGCSEDCPSGVGSRLVQILVQQLNGTLERRNQAKGSPLGE